MVVFVVFVDVLASAGQKLLNGGPMCGWPMCYGVCTCCGCPSLPRRYQLAGSQVICGKLESHNFQKGIKTGDVNKLLPFFFFEAFLVRK